MLRQALVTVVTRNYLHYASLLAQSCRQWQPDVPLTIVVADSRPPTAALPGSLRECHSGDSIGPCPRLVDAGDLGIDQWSRFTFQYTPFELSCALKPYAIAHLFRQGFDQVTFLDADLALYAPLHSVSHALQSHSIALVPHLHRPLPRDGRKPAENNFLNSGTYNGGLVACRADDTGTRFVQWWKDHLRHDCYVDVAGGVFVDQKWLNLVPGLFPDVAIIRQPGCNAGHWTLSQFPLTGDRENGYRVGEQPLECFHFSNFLPDNPYEFMRSQTRVSFQTTPALAQLVRDYHQQLSLQGAEQSTALGCLYDCLSDGTRIKPEWREAIRRNVKALRHIENPFDVSATKQLVERFEAVVHRAYKWRSDWRVQLPSDHIKKQNKKRWKNYWRYLTYRRPR